MLEWLFGKKKQEPQPEVREQKKKKKLSQAQQQTEDKFKELVGSLFDGMMRQIGLDDQKLVSLLQKGFQSKQKKLFNQLLLCDDFLKFKELMVKRNRTLENQALKAMNGQERRASTLDKQRSVVYSSLKQSQQIKKKLEQEQEQILRKVLQMSRIEAQEKKEIQKLVEKVDKEEDHKKIKEEEQRRQIQRQNQRREEQAKKEKLLRLQQARQKQKQKQQQQQRQKRQAEQLRIQNQKKSKMTKTKPLQPIVAATKTVSDLPPIKGISKKQTPPTQAQVELPSPQKPEQQQKQDVKTQSGEQRKKRLLEQREKIRKKKEEQRKKMLEQEQSQNKKVMNIVLQDQGIHDSVHPQQQEKEGDEKVSKDEIQRRKEIMKKIKNRIVDDF